MSINNFKIDLGDYQDKCYMFEALCNSDKFLDRKVRGQGIVNMPIQDYVLKACQSSNRKQKKQTEESAQYYQKKYQNTILINFQF